VNIIILDPTTSIVVNILLSDLASKRQLEFVRQTMGGCHVKLILTKTPVLFDYVSLSN